VIGRSFLFAAAVWFGCMIGAVGLLGGKIVDTQGGFRGDVIEMILGCPLLLLSSWALLNIPFLIIILIVFIRNEYDSYLVWGIVVSVESLMVMAGYARDFLPAVFPLVCAWGIWAVVLTMAGTGIWFTRQWFINRWARDLGMLRQEIAMERAAREASMQQPEEQSPPAKDC
jgi:hypothetical protein